MSISIRAPPGQARHPHTGACRATIKRKNLGVKSCIATFPSQCHETTCPSVRRTARQHRQRACVYDAELALFEPIRRIAIQRLALQPGDTVLDVGCGTGLSFELLRQGIGAKGRIVGIEQAPDMIAKARARI